MISLWTLKLDMDKQHTFQHFGHHLWFCLDAPVSLRDHRKLFLPEGVEGVTVAVD